MFTELQKDLWAWQGAQPWDMPTATQLACGVAEECGELIEALEDSNTKEVIDSLADATVYMIQLCSRLKLDVPTGPNLDICGWRVGIIPSAFAKHSGRISHCCLKMEQGVRGEKLDELKNHMSWLIGYMRYISQTGFAQPYEDTVIRVAKEVMKRDWNLYPNDGLTS